MTGRAAVADLIPHRGDMCLLDDVVHWDRERIVCHSTRHVAIDNPLRAHNRLSAIHAIEFAGQAMAAHGHLTGDITGVQRFGLLMSVRQCTFATDRLDACGSPLVIEATRLAATADAIIYRFAVGVAGTPIVSGQAGIVFTNPEAA